MFGSLLQTDVKALTRKSHQSEALTRSQPILVQQTLLEAHL